MSKHNTSIQYNLRLLEIKLTAKVLQVTFIRKGEPASDPQHIAVSQAKIFIFIKLDNLSERQILE